jgi:capsule polysaccharide modification protein KpsS
MFTLSSGDGVNITATIKRLEGSYSTHCDLDLVSIEKINTLEEREKMRIAEQKKEKGCFVATACYENYYAPEVLVLRQFRDEKLLKTFFGKVFVKFYYSVSPSVAKRISKSDLLKKSIRQYLLEPLIKYIQQKNKR